MSLSRSDPLNHIVFHTPSSTPIDSRAMATNSLSHLSFSPSTLHTGSNRLTNGMSGLAFVAQYQPTGGAS
ncbi:hypothetical protein SBA4_1910008 [Candidatus Sulfopaludibacter sp. SbA4]|nr:hypothetical protein SBA4_1910008 [Candidatus Sulfopaludibacter sp. SbA4]